MLKSEVQIPKAINDDIIAKKLTEVGEKLSPPPSDVQELIQLLDELELYLSRIRQSPPEPLWKALEPVKKAVIKKEYLEHQDKHIKLAVVSCVTEITRITAPDAPFDDNTMKDIFRLIVEAFEELNDDKISSNSCQRRISILETVARIQSSVVMLDLQCDDLILDMFHHFLKNIRNTHPQVVFSSMTNIMALVIEESENNLSELVSVLLDTLKNDKKDVSPVARKLAKSVMIFSANKIRTCLMMMVELKHIVLSEYNSVVASVYQGVSDVSNSSNEVLEDDSKLSGRTISDDLPQAPTEQEQEVACPEKAIVTANANIKMGNDNLMEQLPTSKQKSESCINAVSTANMDNLDSVAANKVGTSNSKKSKSRKTISSVKKGATVILTDGDQRNDQSKKADISDVDTSLKGVDHEEKHDGPSNRQSNSSKKTSQSKQKVKSKSSEGCSMSKNYRKQKQEVACPEQVITTSNVQSQIENGNSMEPPSSPKLKSQYFRRNKKSDSKKDNLDSVASKQVSTSNLKSKSQKNGTSAKKDTPVSRIVGRRSRTKKADASQGDNTFDADLTPEKPDNAIDSQLNSSKKSSQTKQKVNSKSSKGFSGPNASGKNIDDAPGNEVTPLAGDGSKETDDTAGETNKQNVKKGRNSGKRVQSKRKLPDDELSQNKPKYNSKKHKNEDTSTEDVDAEPTLKEFISTHKSGRKTLVIDQTSKAKLKSKKMCAVDAEDKLDTSVHKTKESVVGSKIRVLWPEDELFYAGVVESYDPHTGKHKIVYADGDVEDLLLEDEQYELDEGDLQKLENNQTTQKDEGGSFKLVKKPKKRSNTKSNEAKSETQAKSREDAPKSCGKSKGNDASPNASKKSKGKTLISDKLKTPKASTKQTDDSGIETPKTNTKSKSGKRTKDGTPNSATPKSAGKSEENENNEKKSQKAKPKTKGSAPKTAAADSKENEKAGSSKSKTKGKENESTPGGKTTTTGGKKRNRKGVQK